MAEPEPAGLTRLLSPEAVAERVQALAAQIAPRITDETVAVCLLTGAMWFAADLTRVLADLGRYPLFDALWLSSYADGQKSRGQAELRATFQRPIKGRRVLLIDDVIDSGLSLAEAARLAEAAGARDILTAVFAAKPWPSSRAREPDFAAWKAPDRFLVGYGLDEAGRYRGLAGVYASDSGTNIVDSGAVAVEPAAQWRTRRSVRKNMSIGSLRDRSSAP